MLRPSDEERLSAYFDEELSSEERAEAEYLLRDDPAARDWLDQLEDLHAELQLLPQLRLPGDFAEGVLRRAEREMLLEGDVRERHAREPIAAHNQNGVTSRNGAAVSLATPVDSGSGLASHRPSCGRRSDGATQPTPGQVAGEFSRQSAEAPTPAARTARPTTSQPAAAHWHAPSWLAAAASLLLFAGVLALGTGKENWAKTGPRNEPNRRGTVGLASRSDEAARRTETARRSVVRSTLGKSDGEAVPPRDHASEFAGTSASHVSGGELGAESSTAGDRVAAARTKGPGPSPAETDEAHRDYSKYKKAADDNAEDAAHRFAERLTERSNAARLDAAQTPSGGIPGGAGGGGFGAPIGSGAAPAGKLASGVDSKSGFSPAVGAAGGAETFAFYSALSADRAASGPSSNGPANVVVVDVDGTPAEAFARIEQALLLKREVVAGSDPASDRQTGEGKNAPAKPTNTALATNPAMSAITLRDVYDKKGVFDQVVTQQQPAEKGPAEKGPAEKGMEKGKSLSDALAARVYFVDLPPEELARTLRDVAVVARGKAAGVSVTNLGVSPPPAEGEAILGESSPLHDLRLHQGLGGPGGAPQTRAEREEDRRELAEPAAADRPTAEGNVGQDDKSPSKAPQKRELAPKADPKDADSEAAADKKRLLKVAEEPSERNEKREKDGVAAQNSTPPGPKASAKFAAPATKPSPAKLAAGKEALRFADDSPAQRATSFGMPISPRTTGAKGQTTRAPMTRVPTIIVVRVNQPGRPAAPAAAPAPPSK